jgi:hypothetical protein
LRQRYYATITRHYFSPRLLRRRRHAAAAPPASAAFALPFSMLSYAGDADADISPFTPMPTLFSTLHYYDAITPTLFRHFISPPPFSPIIRYAAIAIMRYAISRR